jgi:nucleoid-associated protein YgaU
MGLGDQFKLEKLTIQAYSDAGRTKSLGKPFEVPYNPESFSLRHENTYQQPNAQGNTAGQGTWSYSRPKQLSVTLVLDGTNVDRMGAEARLGLPTVAQQITSFLTLCYHPVGKIHEPSYLRLHWGQALGGFAVLGGDPEPRFDCRLTSVDVRYIVFDRDGSPLHAELSAVFVEQLDPAMNATRQKFSSPDLTHRRVVVDGDTLPLLCDEIYGSSSHYLRVAQANRLDDFRNLPPGQELIFPPFERARKA